MFEKFTERARKVMSLSRVEAQRLNSDMIGPEHMLLGITIEGAGVAVKVFQQMNLDPLYIKREVEKAITVPPQPSMTLGQIPFTPRAKRVIELAGETASQLGDEVIGTEHLLLALMKENESIAATVLHRIGFRLENVREMVVRLLAETKKPKDDGTEIRQEIKISGTIIDRRSQAFTILQRDGSKHEVLIAQVGVPEQELTIGRRLDIQITSKVKFLD